MLRVESGTVDQVVDFVAVDSTDLKTRETGLSSFTVYRSRAGGTATVMTTPTVTEKSAANMPGVYHLLLDEDMTITNGKLSEVMTFHITQASMAPVTISIELFREVGVGPLKTAQGASGTGLTLESGGIGADDQKLGVGFLIEDSTSATGAIGQLRTAIDSVNSSDAVVFGRAFDTTPSGTIKYREIAGELGTTATEVGEAVVTVSETTPVEVNVKEINDVVLTGAGVTGDKMRAV